ncbi:hypothetical protein [Aliiroseovarius lamellibrachiae]|uniref:hypothetical protein n=1 Tax=Aliiroseovarius lamellibrachiae TaxID=1924933 RepID=UPI001BDFEA36|nr:hypothetical protein [Aliiroseovarius lamellibrachiae]
MDFASNDVGVLSENAKNYITHGESLNLDQRYKCRHRTPWYKIPIVKSSDGFFFKRSHVLPRICSNPADILTTDTAYQITMKPDFNIDNLCLSFYNSITLLFSEIDGRFYGGGVLELTPREFRALPMHMLKASFTQKNKFIDAMTKGIEDQNELFSYSNNAVRKHLGLDDVQWRQIISAHITIRNHRLRHGSKLSKRGPIAR